MGRGGEKGRGGEGGGKGGEPPPQLTFLATPLLTCSYAGATNAAPVGHPASK